MFYSLLGSSRRRAFTIAYTLCVIAFTAGMAAESRSYYCRHCGLGRGEGGITWFGKKEQSRIASVLRSLDLVRTTRREDRIFAALAELKRVSGPADEDRWWVRHRHLFLPRTEVPDAAHRSTAEAT